MNAGELSSEHLGKDLTVTQQKHDGTATVGRGILTAVNHRAEVISEMTLGSAQVRYHIGRRAVEITFTEGSLNTGPEAHVEIHD